MCTIFGAAHKTVLTSKALKQQMYSSSVVFCELVFWGFEGAPPRGVGTMLWFYPHVSVMMFINGWFAALLKPHWHSIPTLASACSYACCVSLTKNGCVYLGLKRDVFHKDFSFLKVPHQKGCTLAYLSKNNMKQLMMTEASKSSYIFKAKVPVFNCNHKHLKLVTQKPTIALRLMCSHKQ